MILPIGSSFPVFELKGVNKDNVLETVNSSFIRDSWSVIYFYPKDFTFICPTEISGMDEIVDYANVYGISGDNEYCKLEWKKSSELIGNIRHTLLADVGLKLARSCGVIDYYEHVAQRATFLLDPKGIIQHVSVNPINTGRNSTEILRTLKALQSGGLTGCSWKPGDKFVT